PFPWPAHGPGFGFTTGSPWEPFGSGAPTANAATEESDPASLLSAYREVIHLRSAHPALQHGGFLRVQASSKGVAAGLRLAPEERLLVLENLTNEPASGVTLDLESSGLCGSPRASLVYPTSLAGSPVAAPTLNSSGGFAGYAPLPT